MMIKSERQMIFICDVQGLRRKIWKEMSKCLLNFVFQNYKKYITQKEITQI
jgi:hypothetical protein